ncbi:hypothetical protein Pcinc_018734 [Petrolisthes cinctipes]|uniref:Uncharacterized protein n=1 Tax=Petrolisthes cinctipes TaxID=88211 RepID=A0AAE1FLY2_PETCI|nr:hypothetical protein Pcinc_018734 [Petrolisthes cinctipes]
MNLGGAVVMRQQVRRKPLRPPKVTTVGEGNILELSITKVEQEADPTLEGFLKHQRSGSSHHQERLEGELWYKACLRNETEVK